MLKMSKIKKRILFYFSVLIFIFLSVFAVLTALGYAYNFSQERFVRTGSFGFKANTAAEVFINGKMEGQTSFLTNSFSIGRLKPGAYQIKIIGQATMPWQKRVEIQEGFFSYFPSVVLLPSRIKSEILIQNLPQKPRDQIWNGFLSFFDKKGTINIMDVNSAGDSQGIETFKTKIPSEDIESLQFDESSEKKILASNGSRIEIIDLEMKSENKIRIMPFYPMTGRIFYKNTIYGLVGRRLNAFDASDGSNGVVADDVLSFKSVGNGLVILSGIKLPVLSFYGFSDKKILPLAVAPHRIVKITQAFGIGDVFYLILNNKNINSLYRIRDNESEKIGNAVYNMRISPSKDKLAYYDNHRVYVLHLSEQSHWPFKKAGDQEIILSSESKILDVQWYKDSEHLFVAEGNSITFWELDDSGGRNNYEILNGVKSFYYSPDQNSVFSFSNNGLTRTSLNHLK